MRGGSIVRLMIIALALGVATAQVSAAAERRIALVVGIGAYQNIPRLKNPASDAQLMARTLKSVGFELVGGKPLIDADKGTLERAIRSFAQLIRSGAVGLFYYSGHGVQIGGTNYLVPVNANVAEELDAKFELVDVGLVLDAMASARNRLNILILDACRNNPFGGRGLRDVGAGLAQVMAPSGTVISYATQPGSVAQDGTGHHSPYTEALAAVMPRPGLDLFATFNDVGLRVKAATGGQQQPWLATSPIEGRFFFALGESEDERRARLETEQKARASARLDGTAVTEPEAGQRPDAIPQPSQITDRPPAPATPSESRPVPFCPNSYPWGCRPN